MRRFLLFTFLLLIVTGCSLLDGEETSPDVTQTPTIPSVGAVPTPILTPEVTEPAPSSSQQTLKVWLTSDISDQADVPGGSILAEQFAAFEAGHPNLKLNIETKAPTGRGSALSYLRSGRNVAPEILPDLIILPTESLQSAADEELIYSLDQHLVVDALQDLFPAANDLATVKESIFGYPFAINTLSHMAFSATVFTDTVPVTWDEMLSQDEATFIFPAGGTQGGELVLQMYLAAGGSLIGDSGQPSLDLEPLVRTLTYFSQGRESDLIPEQAVNLISYDESWKLFLDGDTGSVQTNFQQYARDKDLIFDNDYAAIPGIESPLAAYVDGWAWAISTADPTRQQLASELLNWMVAGPNVGDWTLAAMKLPGRKSAFEQWPIDDPYLLFVQSELDQAERYPVEATDGIMSALNSAIFNVLTAAKSPQQAAEDAIAALQA